MVDRIEGEEQGVFGFRYRLLPLGKVIVWYRFGEDLEVGPVELEEAEADELGALLERACGLVTRARPYTADEDSLISSFRERVVRDGEPQRTRTDPSALRRKPR